MLEKSNIGEAIVSLSKNNANFAHQSSRVIRHGYMAVLTKIANMIQKNAEKEDVKKYLDSVEGWKAYSEEELKKINEVYNKSLGGQQPKQSNMDEDDNENNYEVNMEKIMARFTNFNSISSSSNQDDDDDDENTQEEQKKSNQDEEMFKDLPLNTDDLRVEAEPFDSQYADNNFWKTPLYSENELDQLLSDEGFQ